MHHRPSRSPPARRLLSHTLLVVDDAEFHSAQQPFSLGQSRAVAASLNSLVFHTHFPTPEACGTSFGGASPGCRNDGPRGGTGAAAGAGLEAVATAGSRLAWLRRSFAGLRPAASALLAEHAAAVLADLRARDGRRRYCQPALWLAPYSEMRDGWGRERAERQAAREGPNADAAGILWAFPVLSVVQWLQGGAPEETAPSTAGKRLALLLRLRLGVYYYPEDLDRRVHVQCASTARMVNAEA